MINITISGSLRYSAFLQRMKSFPSFKTLSSTDAIADVRCVNSLVLSTTICCEDFEYAPMITCFSELLILASLKPALEEELLTIWTIHFSASSSVS